VVELKVDMTYAVAHIWNVIGEIPGESSDAVILGNHRCILLFAYHYSHVP